MGGEEWGGPLDGGGGWSRMAEYGGLDQQGQWGEGICSAAGSGGGRGHLVEDPEHDQDGNDGDSEAALRAQDSLS
jgi:hypothetical protein